MSRFKRFVKGAFRALLPPQLKAAVSVVNAFLPEGKRLLDDAAPEAVEAAYGTLTPEQQELAARQIDLELAEVQAGTDKLEAMVAVESAHSNTRPRIAWLMALIIAFQSLLLFLALFIAALDGKDATIAALGETWPFILATMATPAAVVRAYFGMRSREKQARYAAATSQPIGQAIGGFAQAMKSVFGR